LQSRQARQQAVDFQHNQGILGIIMVSAVLSTFLIITLMVCVVSSLVMGLYYLVTGKSRSKKVLKALTVRIILSFVLFVGLLLAFAKGWIAPHPLTRTITSTQK